MLFPFVICLILLYIPNQIVCQNIAPIVTTHLGDIRGYYKESYSGRKYEAYEGIPFAKPPTGNLAFKPPVPSEKWNGVLNAIQPGNICIQCIPVLPIIVRGSQDCLYLNVYAPKHVNNHSLPVVLFIYGGAYQWGNAATGVKFLMDRDIIFVSMNYRVGIFGFLSTEDEVVPGNMGLKDQSLALRWVSENIQYFGGDPKKITLFGQSAGAASVHYHYLSAMSKGLFQNGISLSGTAFGPSKQTENSRAKAKKLAALFGCPTENISQMIECLRSKPAESVAGMSNHFMPFLGNPFTPFGPVIEKYGNNPFIDRSPIEIVNSGEAADVPWFTSIVSQDGLNPGALFVNNALLLHKINRKWDSIAPFLLDYNYTIPLDKHAEVAKKIRHHYLGSKNINKSNVDPFISMLGDRLYGVDAEIACRWQAKKNKSPVHFWYYSYRALTSISDILTLSRKNFGVSHGDDISMILENFLIDPTKRPEDRAMQIKLIDLVVSIAQKGYPDLGLDFEWKAVDPNKEEFEYLHIAGPNNIKMEKNSNLAEKHFWSTINFNENKL